MSLRQKTETGDKIIAGGSKLYTELGQNEDGAVSQKAILEAIKKASRIGLYPITELGNAYTAEQKADIASGKFEKVPVGGHWTFDNGHNYWACHANYWIGTGDRGNGCQTNHMIVMPDGNSLGITGKMNSDNDAAGAYIGSGLKSGTNKDGTSNTALADIAAIIKADFGASNILVHREYFANAITGNCESAGAWSDSDIDLPNEHMINGYSSYHNCKASTSDFPIFYTIDKQQLLLFQLRPDLITKNRLFVWTRDVAWNTNFVVINNAGCSSTGGASNAYTICPVFGITG